MSRKDDEFDELAAELIKLTIIATILLIVGVIVLARWLCQAAAWSSVKLAQRSADDTANEKRSAWIAVFWLVFFALAGLATMNALLALAGLGLGLIVARLVYVELSAWREVQAALRRPGSLELGGFKDTWWGVTKPFALSPEERCQHILLVGATGSGKTSAGTQFIAQDVWNGAAVVVIDPKGDYADAVANLVPDDRIDDVVVIDPAAEAVVGLNPLAGVPPEQWTLATSELLSAFSAYFGHGSFSNRQAHLIRMGLLLLLPLERATLLDLPRLFTDDSFRRQAAFRCPNEAVRSFWLTEFDTTWKRPDVLQPILYKLATFESYPEVAAIFGQTRPRISFDQVVEQHKILILRAASGVVGPDVADLFCTLVAIRVQLACHRRAGTDGPRPFVGLWVDEASHVESGALTRLISESRSFRLGAALLTQTEKFFSHELQVSLETNVGTRLRTFQKDDSYWLEVQRQSMEEPLVFPHPGPLAAVDRARVDRIYARSRALYARKPAQALPLEFEEEGQGAMTATGEVAPPMRPTRPKLNLLGGVDVDEE
ncbi:MAG: type IV secretory system conjugative DNA transfer family protein [Dehalococcoidia bacterium]